MGLPCHCDGCSVDYWGVVVSDGGGTANWGGAGRVMMPGCNSREGLELVCSCGYGNMGAQTGWGSLVLRGAW